VTHLAQTYYKDSLTLLSILKAFPDTVQEVKRILEKNTKSGGSFY